jgi:two-component system sensor histidine kinase UhpB
MVVFRHFRAAVPPSAAMRPLAAMARMSLALQFFLAGVAVVAVIVAALALAPFSIGPGMSLGEVAVVTVSVGLLLLAGHVVIRRLLAPMRRLADEMLALDPREPDPGLRRRVAPDDRDVERLLAAFELLLERLREERLESDRRAIAAQEAERREVAGEVHDELGQTLTALALRLDRTPMAPEDRAQALELVGRALDDVRSIARRLRPEGLEDLGLVNTLIALCDRVERESGLPVRRRLPAPPGPIDPEVALGLYRIAQEALTNVIRHAGATYAEVRLDVADGRLELVVRDDGAGPPASPGPDGGIARMRARAALLGGELSVGPAPGGGTAVRCSVPGCAASGSDVRCRS